MLSELCNGLASFLRGGPAGSRMMLDKGARASHSLATALAWDPGDVTLPFSVSFISPLQCLLQVVSQLGRNSVCQDTGAVLLRAHDFLVFLKGIVNRNLLKKTLCVCAHCAKSLQLFSTLCDSVDWSPPGHSSSLQGILQARMLSVLLCPPGSSRSRC